MSIIAFLSLGFLDPTLLHLQPVFGALQTAEIIVTDERLAHIQARHPQDYCLFQAYGACTVLSPDLILQDTKHAGTIFAVRRLPETNLNVVVRLALGTDVPGHKNSVMTFYRIRDKNLHKLMEKYPLLYKRE